MRTLTNNKIDSMHHHHHHHHPSWDSDPAILNPGIPAEFSKAVIQGLAASNPGITGLKKIVH